MTIIVLAASNCLAQGLIRKIPPEGHWVKFDWQLQLNGRKISRDDSYLEIKNLGSPAKFPKLTQLEIRENHYTQGRRDTTFLIWIDKADIEKHGNLSKKIKKMWYKRPNQAWLESTGYESLSPYLSDPKKVTKSGMNEVFKNGELNYQCLSIEGKRTLTFFGRDESIQFKILYNTKSPFGGVELRSTSLGRSDDPKAGPEKLEFTRIIRLKEMGRDAKPSFEAKDIENAKKEIPRPKR